MLFLPVANPDLSPIELVWQDLKSYVRRHNVDFTMSHVKELFLKRQSELTAADYKKYFDHAWNCMLRYKMAEDEQDEGEESSEQEEQPNDDDDGDI